MKKKIAISIVAVALVLCCAIGGTLAWLTAESAQVTNTFTVGDINIELKEDSGASANYQFKMVPGNTITKDPKVTVKANSEACYLFVKVTKSGNFDQFLTYAMADGWTQYKDTDVWYRDPNVAASAADQTFEVLKNNAVTVNGTVTKEMMTSSDFATPTLTFKAAAVQEANLTLDAAYAEALAKLG